MSIATALTLFAAVAGAAETAKNADAPAKAHGYATRDQLRECMDLQAALKLRFHGLETANTDNDAMGDRLEAEGAKVHDLQAGLDRSDAAAVTAFRQAAAGYNERVVAWKKTTADAQAADDAYKVDSAGVDQKCVGLSYRPQDIEAVVKERKKAAAASGATP